ncbi:MAG: pilus assembly protein N-terminal domain-containing protein [Pirellulales bacterium]|nr:pilus assembly protein N-terminal domain-containing protein [Pirellulales bacterium]
MVRIANGHGNALRMAICATCAILGLGPTAFAQQAQGRKSIVHRVESASERLELTVASSRILRLGAKIPRAQVGNPDILRLTPLSETEIQIFAQSTGVTTVNLWDDKDNVYSIDVMVYPDARVLARVLKDQFPNSALTVRPLATSVVIAGYVDRADYVSRIMKIAEDYYPKVINNIKVGGVQQVLLDVKIMEVSRTKLRRLGVDWSYVNGENFVVSSVSQLIDAVAASTGTAASNTGTIQFGLVSGNSSFFGVIDALRQNQLVKILAEPKLVAVSGRPAYFRSGGELPILVPQSLGTVSVEYKQYGTQVDFVPIVLGENRIRLEVRPRVSELDEARGVSFNGNNIPGFRVREVDTAVEMDAGQTLALAGLVQTKIDTVNRGVPYLAEMPVVGIPFRKVEDTNNEVELLIMVRPQLVDALDPHQVPQGGPGLNSGTLCDHELYCDGYMEVPNCGPNNIRPYGLWPADGAEVIDSGAAEEVAPPAEPATPSPDEASRFPSTTDRNTARRLPRTTPYAQNPAYHNSPSNLSARQPILRNGSTPAARVSTRPRSAGNATPPSFIGPVGYDDE